MPAQRPRDHLFANGIRESESRGLGAGGCQGTVAPSRRDLEGDKRTMTTERTELGRDIETALGEVLAHVRGETELPCRIVENPDAERIISLRKRFRLSRRKFAERFGLDVRALQEWEQGRRVPDRAARVSADGHRPRPRSCGKSTRRGRRRRTSRKRPNRDAGDFPEFAGFSLRPADQKREFRLGSRRSRQSERL